MRSEAIYKITVATDREVKRFTGREGTENMQSATTNSAETSLEAELKTIEAATARQAEALAEAEAELEKAKERAQRRDEALNRLWELRQKTVQARTTTLHIQERLKNTALFDLLNK